MLDPSGFVGNLGQAMIFLFTLATLGIVGPLWLCYASHCFLVVITESSIGDPEVRWPDETVVDWWWKPLYCGLLLVFWVPVGATLASPLLFTGPWPFGITVAAFVWFIYPIGLLSVMEAHSAIAVLHMPLFLRLARYAGAVLVVGLITLPLGAAVGGLLALATLKGVVWAIPTAFVLPVVLLVYARSWGRLAWMVLNVKARRRPDAEPPPEAAAAMAHDPWALPPREEVPEMEVEVEEPEPTPSLPLADDDDDWPSTPGPYDVPAVETGEAPFSHDEYYRKYRKREEERKARAEGRKPGEKRRRRRANLRTAFGEDFWPFLFEHRTQRVAVSLGMLTLVVLALVRVLVSMIPGS
jgi:hypothetical protein